MDSEDLREDSPETRNDPNNPIPGELQFAEDCLKRDKQYVELVEHYVKNQKRTNSSQLAFKWIFFIVVLLAFSGIMIVGTRTILNISKKASISWQDVGTAFAGLASLLGTIIVLPSKIAEHLFPAGGNKDSMDFIKSMQQYDLSRDSSSVQSDSLIWDEQSENDDGDIDIVV